MNDLRPLILLTGIFSLFFLVLTVQKTHAYLDPGTGSYLLQLMAGGLLGLAFTIKIYWKRIKAFLLKIFMKR